MTQASGTLNLGEIKLELDACALSDGTSTSSDAIERKTTVEISTLTPVFIEEK